MFFQKVIVICLLISGSFSFTSNSCESVKLICIQNEKRYILLILDLFGRVQKDLQSNQLTASCCALVRKDVEIDRLLQMESELNELKLNFTKYEQEILPLLDDALNNPSDSQKVDEALLRVSHAAINLNNSSFFIKQIRQLTERLVENPLLLFLSNKNLKK